MWKWQCGRWQGRGTLRGVARRLRWTKEDEGQRAHRPAVWVESASCMRVSLQEPEETSNTLKILFVFVFFLSDGHWAYFKPTFCSFPRFLNVIQIYQYWERKKEHNLLQVLKNGWYPKNVAACPFQCQGIYYQIQRHGCFGECQLSPPRDWVTLVLGGPQNFLNIFLVFITVPWQ